MEKPFMKPFYFSKKLQTKTIGRQMKNIWVDKSKEIETIWKQFDLKGFQRFGEPIVRCFTRGSLIVHFQITISTKDLDFFDTP